MRKFLLLFIIAASALACLRAGGISSGLNFASHEAMKEARTSLQLNDGKAFRFPKGFTLDFESAPGRGTVATVTMKGAVVS